MQRRRKVWKDKRPVAVTVVAWGIVILFIVRLVQVFRPLIEMNVLERGLDGPLVQGVRLTPLGCAVLTSGVYLLASLIGIVVLIGFLRLRRWAWVILMAWTGASLAVGLIDYFYRNPNYLVMASNAVIALALNQVDVQRIFQIRIEQDDAACLSARRGPRPPHCRHDAGHGAAAALRARRPLHPGRAVLSDGRGALRPGVQPVGALSERAR